jgi:hypothetical protein
MYTVFSGCSYTAGEGFLLKKSEPGLWTNQLHSTLFSDTQQLNVGRSGRSNAGIYQDTVSALVSNQVKYAVVEWTNMPRYEMRLGLETYDTTQFFIPNGPCRDHNLNSISYSKKYLNDIRDRFTALAHDSYEIQNLVGYVNDLVKLSKITGTRLFFVNGICPWDTDFFEQKNNVLPSEYTNYTCMLLNASNRHDHETSLLYQKMHESFDQLGGIQQHYWLNLYNSMRRHRLDVNSDGSHPGLQSNQIYVDFLSNAIKERLY